MLRRSGGWFATALFLWCGGALALGLGEVEVKSQLHQPFSAVIPLSVGQPAELETLAINVANAKEYERAGVDRDEYLNTLQFEVRDNSIVITSRQPAREPFLTLLLDVRWTGGRLLREYTMLLDPPTLAEAMAARAPAPQAAPAPAEAATPSTPPAEAPPVEPAAAAPAESASPGQGTTPEPVTPEGPAAASAGSTYGPVQPRETLWSIAYKLRPNQTITMDQMQIAIFEANPKAFENGRISGLMKGATLRIPDEAEIRNVDPVRAREQVSGSSAAAPAPRPAAVAPKAEAPAPAPEPEPEPEPAPEPEPVAAAPEPAAETPAPSEPAPEPTPQPGAGQMVDAEPAPAAEPEPALEEPVQTQPVEEEAPVAAAPIRRERGALESLTDMAGSPMVIPAAGGLILLLLGVVAYRQFKKRREASEESAGERASMIDPGALAAAVGQPMGGDHKTPQQQLEEDTMGIEAPLASTAAVEPRLASTTRAPSPAVSTSRMAPPEPPPPAPAAEGPKLDFDVTAQFAADTVQINLDANDPIAEADFHLAYGLYDEAALLLKQAAQKNPDRAEIRVKLAETYFAAGKNKEFVDTAQGLKGKVSDSDWQKIAIMGQQLAPEAAIFKDAVGGGVNTEVDLSFDEPAAPAAPAAPRPAPMGRAEREQAEAAALDFKLEDLELPSPEPATRAVPAADPKGNAGDALEFDIGDFKLDTAPAAAQAPDAGGVPELRLDELDLGSFDLKDEPAIGKPETAHAPAAPAGKASPAQEDSGLSLDSDISIDEAPITGDEAATKLDLARAYMDMGDSDMAKSLLQEVVQQGSAQQKKEAQELIGRLPG